MDNYFNNFFNIGGYVFGKVFRWKKLTSVSPNKTLSGVIGSFFFSILSVFFIGGIVSAIGLLNFEFFLKLKYFLLAIIFSLVAQLGDISISYLKRLEKIKDTGKILPGHGGIFDRIDGLMFVVIIATFTYNLNLFP